MPKSVRLGIALRSPVEVVTAVDAIVRPSNLDASPWNELARALSSDVREEAMEVDWISNAAVYEAWFHQATKISKLYEFNFTEVRRGWFDHTAGRAPTRIKVGGTGTVFDGEYFATRVFGNIQYHLDGEIEMTLPPIGVVCDGKTILCKTHNKWWAFRTLRKSNWQQYDQFKCEMKHKNELLPVRGTKWVEGKRNNVNCVGTGFEPIIQCRFD